MNNYDKDSTSIGYYLFIIITSALLMWAIN